MRSSWREGKRVNKTEACVNNGRFERSSWRIENAAAKPRRGKHNRELRGVSFH